MNRTAPFLARYLASSPLLFSHTPLRLSVSPSPSVSPFPAPSLPPPVLRHPRAPLLRMQRHIQGLGCQGALNRGHRAGGPLKPGLI